MSVLGHAVSRGPSCPYCAIDLDSRDTKNVDSDRHPRMTYVGCEVGEFLLAFAKPQLFSDNPLSLKLNWREYRDDFFILHV